MTVRVIQAISRAEMMISAMPTTVSTEAPPSRDPDRWPDLVAIMGPANAEIKNAAPVGVTGAIRMSETHIGADERGGDELPHRLAEPRTARRPTHPRRGRSWRRGISEVSSVATSIGAAPSDSSSANTSSRSSWHSRTMIRGLPDASASSARSAAVSDS